MGKTSLAKRATNVSLVLAKPRDREKERLKKQLAEAIEDSEFWRRQALARDELLAKERERAAIVVAAVKRMRHGIFERSPSFGTSVDVDKIEINIGRANEAMQRMTHAYTLQETLLAALIPEMNAYSKEKVQESRNELLSGIAWSTRCTSYLIQVLKLATRELGEDWSAALSACTGNFAPHKRLEKRDADAANPKPASPAQFVLVGNHRMPLNVDPRLVAPASAASSDFAPPKAAP